MESGAEPARSSERLHDEASNEVATRVAQSRQIDFREFRSDRCRSIETKSTQCRSQNGHLRLVLTRRFKAKLNAPNLKDRAARNPRPRLPDKIRIRVKWSCGGLQLQALPLGASHFQHFKFGEYHIRSFDQERTCPMLASSLMRRLFRAVLGKLSLLFRMLMLAHLRPGVLSPATRSVMRILRCRRTRNPL